MDSTTLRRLQAAMLSVMILGSMYGCTGRARRQNVGGTTAQRGGAGAGVTNTSVRGGTAGGTHGTAGAPGGGTTAGGADGTGFIAGPASTTVGLGRQISDHVAHLIGMGRTTGAGGGTAGGGTVAAGNAGVSTLVIENLAFVGVDTSAGAGATGLGTTGTGMTGPGMTGAGTTGAGTTGVGLTGGLEERIRSQVRSAFPQVEHVYVTTDPTMVRRIARVSTDVHVGASAAPRLSEIFSIATSMAGTTGGAGGTGTTGTGVR